MPGKGGGAPGAAWRSVSSWSGGLTRPASGAASGREATSRGDVPPGNGNPGGGKAPFAPGWFCGSMGLLWAWPSAAYELVMESMTDWAFSWPISAGVGMGGQRVQVGRGILRVVHPRRRSAGRVDGGRVLEEAKDVTHAFLGRNSHAQDAAQENCR